MIGRALAEGLRSATRRPGLVALLWAWNLALALIVALPFWTWISAVSANAPATDVLLDGADLGVIMQLVLADSRIVPALMAAVAGLALVSLLSGAFLSGGILEVVLSDGDGQPLLLRFFRGAGHFFGRFLRLLVIAGITAVPVTAAVSAAVGAATRRLTAGGWEPATLWAMAVVLACVGLTVGFFVLALDYARVMTVLSDSRSMFRIWWRALRFVVRRTPGVASIGLVAGGGVLAAFAVTTAFDVAYSARTAGVIAGAIVLHQAMALARTAVRVGQVSAQGLYCKGLLPEPVPVPVPVPLPAPIDAPLPAEGPPSAPVDAVEHVGRES